MTTQPPKQEADAVIATVRRHVLSLQRENEFDE